MNGGYDTGYQTCPCFWGTTPATMVVHLAELLKLQHRPEVLDVGCGDGKNARYLARNGIAVHAFDVSEYAISNAKKLSPDVHHIEWEIADLRTFNFEAERYEAVVAAGSLHCLFSEVDVQAAIRRVQRATKSGGYNVVQVFNARSQDLRGHDNGFDPVLLPHGYFVEAYAGWEIIEVADDDIVDRHPHTDVVHHHSITRILAGKPA